MLCGLFSVVYLNDMNKTTAFKLKRFKQAKQQKMTTNR